MARRRTQDVTVGALVALALLLLAVAIMAVGGESKLFASKSVYRVVFPAVDGLVVGSAVKIAGVQVGTVSAVRLSADPAQSGIEIEIGVDETYAQRVREDSRAKLRILQFLTGEKFVEITPGSSEFPVLPEGSLIEPVQDPELLKQAEVAAENINEITVSLKNILATLESGEGLIGQMINDPEFGQEGLAALKGSFQNLQLLTNDLLAGKGFVGRLLRDDAFAARLDDLGRAIESVSTLLTSIQLDEGAVGALLEPGGAGEVAIEDLRQASASLKVVTWRLENGHGLLGKLLEETSYEGDLAQDLGTALANLAEITGKINRGEGTLGALVNERVLHDGAEEVIAGVNDSKFARWVLRHYQKRGIELEDPTFRPHDAAPADPDDDTRH